MNKRPYFTLIVIAYGVYLVLFIWRTSFAVEGTRFFALFDDAMISMRYAENLAHGRGLCWNPGGERVEGFTNLLWVLYMSVFHLLPLAKSKLSILVQLSGALFLMLNLLVVKRIADVFSEGSSVVSICAVLLTAFYLPLTRWGVLGTEVSVLTLIMSIALWKTLQCLKHGNVSILLFVLLGLGTLIRIDMMVPYLGILLWLLITDPRNRAKNLSLGLLVFLLCVLGQTLFRSWYYGELFPNTYYLKMTGFPLLLRITRGIYVLAHFSWQLNWLLILLSLSVVLFRRDPLILTLFWVVLVQAAYSVFVGGDAWEEYGGSNRYLSLVMPAFFVCFSLGTIRLGAMLLERLKERFEWLKHHTAPLLFGFIFLSLMTFNAIQGPKSLLEWLLLRRSPFVNANKTMVEMALVLKTITEPEARIAVTLAGVVPYFSERPSIDMLGKNEKKTAREKARLPQGLSRFIAFDPGHVKWNYAYSIGELKPDVVAQLYVHPEEAEPYLKTDYLEMSVQGFDFYLLKDSRSLRWDTLQRGTGSSGAP